jgi:hypothetical protein
MHEFFSEKIRNPAHNRRAGLMRQFRSGRLDSSKFSMTYSRLQLYFKI